MDEEHKEPDALVTARLLSRDCVLFEESTYAIKDLFSDAVGFVLFH